MDIEDLKKMTLPKLKEEAKKITELKGVSGMKKEDLVNAIAKAGGISDKASAKEHTSISSVKHEIQALKKQKGEIQASPQDHHKLKKIKRKIKRLRRLTRELALKASKETKAASPAEPESSPAPEGAAPPETPAVPESPPAASS
ncbi:MAG: Rho termination factor N-terminal domain-containing protein [Candidatus Binatia bacterium]